MLFRPISGLCLDNSIRKLLVRGGHLAIGGDVGGLHCGLDFNRYGFGLLVMLPMTLSIFQSVAFLASTRYRKATRIPYSQGVGDLENAYLQF